MFILRDMLRVAGERFDSRKVKDFVACLVVWHARGKDAVRDSTKLVGLCWSGSDGVKAIEVLVYNSYLEQLLA